MIGAIAAGNTVVLKPSEQSYNCAAVMQKIMEAALDPDCYVCVQGAIPETSALLDQRWDKIFFTGSERTAKVVAQAAAKNLTPVALELGGRNPAIVTKKADMRLVARRLLWSKTMNAGQVCISQNYILADKDVSMPSSSSPAERGRVLTTSLGCSDIDQRIGGGAERVFPRWRKEECRLFENRQREIIPPYQEDA